MCDPVFGAIMLVVSVASSVAGSVVQGNAQKKQAEAAQDAYEHNERVALMLAQEEIQIGEEEQRQHSIEVRRLLSRQAMSSRGVDMSSEYFSNLYSDTELYAQLDNEMILENARRRSLGRRMEAKGFAIQAEAAADQLPYIAAGTTIGSVNAVASAWPTAKDTWDLMQEDDNSAEIEIPWSA